MSTSKQQVQYQTARRSSAQLNAQIQFIAVFLFASVNEMFSIEGFAIKYFE